MDKMKINPFQTSAVIIADPEIEDFVWTFIVSPRSKLQQNIESVSFGGFNFNNLQFKSGFLANTDHKWGLCLYSNQINTFMALPKRDIDHRYSVHDSRIELLSLNEIKAQHKISFQQDETAAAPKLLWTSFWINSDRSWDDSIDAIRIIFRVGRESRSCVYTTYSDKEAEANKHILNTVKHVNCEEFLLSTYLSDVVFECKGKEFPAHRLLLSCRSPVFNRMFRASMKEGQEGRVVIEDMEPEILEELFRFIYCGRVQSIDELCVELFAAADKYDILPLKVTCENEMVNRVDADNALEMYMTADVHGAKFLLERAFDVIRTNKKQVFRDRDIFKIFSNRYPDVAFDLFSNYS